MRKKHLIVVASRRKYISNRLPLCKSKSHTLSLIIGALLLVSVPIKAVVILVHGTFAQEAMWCKPGGEFYQELEKQSLQLGHKLISFTWSGKFSSAAREKAGAFLSKLIEHYIGIEKIIVIGHSHGANIIFLASQKLKSSNIAATQQYLIERIYLLGAPIDTNEYYPCMNTIKHCYSLYSHGDYIQKIAWLYGRTLPNQERISNFEVCFVEKNNHIKPGHQEMHDVRIARWLLALPDELSILKAYGFESYNPGNDGQLSFDQGQVSFKNHVLPS